MSRPLPNNFHRPCQPPPPHKPSRRNTIGGSALAPTRHPVGYHAQKRLDARFKDLEEERRKFTEAAGRSQREKAPLETERLKFREEKQSWEVEQVLAQRPPTPATAEEQDANSGRKVSFHERPASRGGLPALAQSPCHPSPSRQLPEFKTSIAAPSPPPSPHLTNAFVQPPESP
ncbi:hypothetical protein L226DRAFT_573041 [Lentinus tigrinus ALCF2SS1-7]|uniref:Uncharacterized protein n=1 Tax=Lentinus tigrinus ALCF2SS1-6 TaxID=1328759 RepID=A0A5C2RVA5_9APHY|nr:hypothetical protein L227DRAFT_615268 [Lentinus tigrinus ALCF2SS1-6]RPD72618.1 hypothetical protein L226DRAFT_573041 [Lentinus tigrinus ALCF2SS1-7]